jgi:hypothetical protein
MARRCDRSSVKILRRRQCDAKCKGVSFESINPCVRQCLHVRANSLLGEHLVNATMKQCNTVNSALLALLLAELLKLAHRLLLTRVSNQAYPVDPRLFALSIAINHEYD